MKRICDVAAKRSGTGRCRVIATVFRIFLGHAQVGGEGRRGPHTRSPRSLMTKVIAEAEDADERNEKEEESGRE